MDNGNIKRVNLRINIEDPIDKIIWNYIKDKKKKGTYIKKIIYDTAVGNKIDSDELRKDCYSDIQEEELDDSGMEGF